MTNVENSRSIIDYNPKSGVRIIDASAGAAKKLGFYEQGLARVNSSSTC
jgi:rare lipoprotein A (peptidoglycan hydrolase)